MVGREREVRGRVGLAEGERERVQEVAGLVLARGVGRVTLVLLRVVGGGGGTWEISKKERWEAV